MVLYCTRRSSTVQDCPAAAPARVALAKFEAGSPVSSAIFKSSGEGASAAALQAAGISKVLAGGLLREKTWVSSMVGSGGAAPICARMIRPYLGSIQTFTLPSLPRSSSKTLALTLLTISVPAGLACFAARSLVISMDAWNGSPQSPPHFPLPHWGLCAVGSQDVLVWAARS